MSGGVDSLTTALLLKEQGVEIWGIHMIVGGRFRAERRPRSSSSHFAESLKFIERIKDDLQIEIKTVDLRDVFDELIIKPFVSSYLEGLTPNPCIPCNARVKFGILLQKALEFGARSFATGHYVRIRKDSISGRWQLLRGTDKSKEQSYFLFQLSQEQLEYALFPLGEKTKKEVYEYIRKKNLPVIPSGESHEICFIPDNDYKNFIRKAAGIEDVPGYFVNKNGRIVGKHEGIFRYTIGQRRGIGIPASEPYYVTGIDPATNTIRIGKKDELFGKKLIVSGLNWVSIPPPSGAIKALVQIRYRHRASEATIEPLDKGRALVEFLKPQRAITPGQYAGFYDGDLLLGGGQIVKVAE